MNQRAGSTLPAPLPEPSAVPRAATASALALHVDRVVLDGFDFGLRDRARLQSALQGELAALLAAPGQATAASPLGRALAALNCTPLRIERQPDAAALGRAIARALHAGLLA